MNEIRHHLGDGVLLAYSAGSLAEGYALVVAAHLSLCDECRAQAEAFDAVGGALIEDAPGVALSSGSLAATLARLDMPSVETAPAAADPVLPAPVVDYVGGGLEAVRWKSVGAGVRQAVLKTGPGATVRLLNIPAGARMPDHGHRGLELTLVLKGAFRDEFDRFARGDVESANEALSHTPIAEPDGACICLTASDAPLRFAGWLPRLAQPFLGI